MSFVRAHSDLRVWKKTLTLASRIYATTHGISPAGAGALAGELQRAATSLASYVAEGSACGNRLEYIRFLQLGRSAMAALATRVCIARELGLIAADAQLDQLIAQIDELLAGRQRRLREHRERARGFPPPER